MKLSEIKQEILSLKNPGKIAIYKNFHKTSFGSYAEGEEFLGLTAPQIRKIAEKYNHLDFSSIKVLLESNVHEEKYVAAEILACKYSSGNQDEKERVVKFYLKNAKNLSGWDLVDTTASQILGRWLLDKDREVLYKLAGSDNLWERRISIISTYAFIKNQDFADALKISEILIHDKHDLIHKAVGWMLREVGKKNQNTLNYFLKKHYKIMPRTMLRYSIEKFPQKARREYLKGII